MEAASTDHLPHVVCVPFPAQGHITPMMKLAKILHHKGFFITFVNTEFNHRRLFKTLGPDALSGHRRFRFESIPDGLPSSDADATQDIPSLCHSTSTTCHPPFLRLLRRLNSTTGVPPVSSIVSDGVMSFTLDAAQELSIPDVLFWTCSSCGMLCYTQYAALIHKGIVPFKDLNCIFNGYLDTEINWIPGIDSIRLRDMPSFIRTTDPDDIMIKFILRETGRISKAAAVIVNTFHSLEGDTVHAISETTATSVYSVGPLQLQLDQIVVDDSLKSIGSSLWMEGEGYMEWLNAREEKSVVYVNFGSITVMTAHQLCEFAWGLANSMVQFLWVVRPDVVKGEKAMILPAEFVEKTKERGMILSWCEQEKVLRHSAVGGFLTHSGWNSTLESLVGGVPMVCWPFFAEQQTNSYFCRKEGWGVGIEIDADVKRREVEALVRELMWGGKGKEMRERAVEWGRKAAAAVAPGGSSAGNLERVIREVLLQKRHAD